MFKMQNRYTGEDVESIRKSSLLVGETLAEIAKHIEPGVETLALDKIGETFIRDHGAKPVFKGLYGFPNALCISVNDEVVHGIPGNRTLKDGDIVSVDCGTDLNGFCGDSAYTFAVGEISAEVQHLLDVTKASLYRGIAEAKAGNRVGDIGYAIQSYCESEGFGIVRELCGHGLGRHVHEKPDVPNFGRRGNGPQLKEGMVIAIEPMVTQGTHKIYQNQDGWTIRTQDGLYAAHYEHDVVVGAHQADILSSFESIEKNLKK